MINRSTFRVSDSVTGSCLISTFTNIILVDIWCSFSKSCTIIRSGFKCLMVVLMCKIYPLSQLTSQCVVKFRFASASELSTDFHSSTSQSTFVNMWRCIRKIICVSSFATEALLAEIGKNAIHVIYLGYSKQFSHQLKFFHQGGNRQYFFVACESKVISSVRFLSSKNWCTKIDEIA